MAMETKAAKEIAPDLVIMNATLRTMDTEKATAEALAVLGNRIVAVGATEEIRPLAGKRTRTQ